MALETTTELRNFLAEEVGDKNPGSTEQTRLLRLLNSAHLEIVGGGGVLNVDNRNIPQTIPAIFSWALAEDPLIATTSEPIDTGTVAIAEGATALTFSSAPSVSVLGWYIRIAGKSTVYKITAHSSTSATLDSAYVNDTETAATYECFKLDYTFGDTVSDRILLPADYIRSFEGHQQISLTSKREVRNAYPLSTVSKGDPVMAGLVGNTDGQITIHLNIYPTNARKLELLYVPVPDELTVSGVDPIIPKDDRKILVHLAAYYQLIYRNDDKAQIHLDIARRMFKNLKAKDSAFSQHNDRRYGYLAPFPGGFSRSRRKGFTSGDYEF